MGWTRTRLLGRGASASTVSLARSAESGAEGLAVKSAELAGSELLQREAGILASLSSPYVIGYLGCEVTEEEEGVGAVFNLLMEYAPYGTLTDAARKRGGRLNEDEIVRYTRQMLRGLEYIHSRGIVHCDIKGRNVLIGENGEAKIADFGCAKRLDSEAEPVRGSPVYMAPETARGERQGFESDVWSVGCTVIEMATGSAPWVSDGDADPVSVLYRIGYSGQLPQLPSFLSEQAKDFLGRCLNRDPKERWSASQLLNHPFLNESKSQLKEQAQESNSNSNPKSKSKSPTSVIDREFWNSVEEEEEGQGSESVGDLEHPCSRVGSPWERIARLGLASGGSDLHLDNDGDWITVREGSAGEMMGETSGSDNEFTLHDDIDREIDPRFGESRRSAVRDSEEKIISCTNLHLGMHRRNMILIPPLPCN